MTMSSDVTKQMSLQVFELLDHLSVIVFGVVTLTKLLEHVVYVFESLV